MLKKLGIEIRKIGDPKAFYRDVDSVLVAGGIKSGDVTKDIQVNAAAHSLQKMFNGSHFSVCTINSCKGMCGIVIQQERMNVYDAIHCVNWSDMLPEFRQQIIALVMDDFRPVFGELSDEAITDISTINC
jgi:hypothetical protein